MRVIRRISAVVIGFVLFLAGLLKLMDPVGSTLIVEEYLKFFHIGFLRPAAGFISVAMALTETICGAALITGVWRKIVAIVSGAMLGFFSIVTAVLLIANPEMDCGCFGEALKLSHLQSFLKNIALCLLWLLAFIPLREAEPTRKVKYASFGVVAVAVALFYLYSSLSIPMMDFTPFKPGAELSLPPSMLSFYDDEAFPESPGGIYDFGSISSESVNPEVSAPSTASDSCAVTATSEVTDNNLSNAGTSTSSISSDGTGTDADSKPELSDSSKTTNEAAVSTAPVFAAELLDPSTLLSFCDASGEYADSLAFGAKVMTISIFDVAKIAPANWEKIARQISRNDAAGFTTLVLCASTPESLQAPSSVLPYCYFADRKTLLTLNRSNSGQTYLSDGQVIAKWAFGKLPTSEQLESLAAQDSTEAMIEHNNARSFKLQAYLLFVFAVMLLL